VTVAFVAISDVEDASPHNQMDARPLPVRSSVSGIYWTRRLRCRDGLQGLSTHALMPIKADISAVGLCRSIGLIWNR